jgi:hypothetical protein
MCPGMGMLMLLPLPPPLLATTAPGPGSFLTLSLLTTRAKRLSVPARPRFISLQNHVIVLIAWAVTSPVRVMANIVPFCGIMGRKRKKWLAGKVNE